MSRPVRALGAAALAGGLALLGRAGAGVPTAFGAGRAALRAAADGSAHAVDGRFRNDEPTEVMLPGNSLAIVRAMLSRRSTGRPVGPVPLSPRTAWPRPEPARRDLVRPRQRADRDRRPPGAGRPGVGRRVSPSRLSGRARLHPVPIPLDELPARRRRASSRTTTTTTSTCRPCGAAARRRRAPFVVPLGIGAHLRGVGGARRSGSSSWTGTSGRRSAALTADLHRGPALLRARTAPATPRCGASWAVAGPAHRVFFGGDTGYTPAFAGIGAAARPVRPDAAADRRLQRPVAGHPHEPGGGRRARTATRRRGCWCRSTGRPSTWASTLGGAGRAAAAPRPRPRAWRSPCPGPASGSTSPPRRTRRLVVGGRLNRRPVLPGDIRR